jgi:threonine dehydrogenase-like Zn-dependent dehydrogenase
MTTTAMRAAVFTGAQRLHVASLALPDPGPHDIRIRLEGCGVCASNLPVWEGRPWFAYPLAPGAPGHEGWGRIDALGRDVRGLALGQRVAALSFHAYATHDTAPADAVVPLPASLEGVPFPGEALGCAMNVFRRSAIAPAQTVAIIGIGFLGALLTALAAQAGARVIAISRRAFALEIARQYGATATIRLDDPQQVVAHVHALTGDAGCERVIEAVGQQGPLDLAGELTRVGGRLIIAGYHQDGLRQVNMQLWNWRGLEVMNAHERDPTVIVEGMRMAVDAVTRGTLNPMPLYTHKATLEQLPMVLAAMQQRPDGFLKAWIAYG